MQKHEARFLNFPLFLLSRTLSEPAKGMQLIASWVFVEYARHCEQDFMTALAQLAYVVTRRPDEHLPSSIVRMLRKGKLDSFLESCEEAWVGNKEGNGFCEGVRELFEVEPVVLSKGDHEALIEWRALDASANFFHRKIHDQESVRDEAAQAQRFVVAHEEKTGKLAMATVPADFFFQTKDGQRDSESMRLLRTVAGVRSLIGQKDFTGTTKDMLRARMIGAKSPAIASMLASADESIRIELDLLQSRKRFDRLLTEAASRGFFGKLGMGRRVYVSTKIKHPDKLRERVSTRMTRREKYRKAEQMARRRDSKGTSRGAS